MGIPIHEKNAERWEKKAFVADPAFPGVTVDPQHPHAGLRHHHLPGQVPVPAGTQKT